MLVIAADQIIYRSCFILQLSQNEVEFNNICLKCIVELMLSINNFTKVI